MWFKVDDGFADHDKTAAAVDACPQSVALWLIAGSKCGKGLTDGVVTASLLSRCGRLAGLSPSVTAKASSALVSAGLWHEAKSARRCDHCSEVKLPPGAFLFHDWWEYNPTEDETLIPTERKRWRRKEELRRNRKLCEAIDSRDRNLCRYCGTRVNWKDKRGTKGGTRDHVDPDGDNAMANVVVACRACNGGKRDRTPEEWVAEEGPWSPENPRGGRLLLPVPEAYTPTPTQAGPGTRPSPTQVEPKTDLGSRARHARDGSAQVGPGSDSGRTWDAPKSAPVTDRLPVDSARTPAPSNGHQPEGDT